VRVDHKFRTGRDQAFGRLTYFRGHAEPATAFPDGSGTIRPAAWPSVRRRRRRGRSRRTINTPSRRTC
jgi:hypothetical protein